MHVVSLIITFASLTVLMLHIFDHFLCSGQHLGHVLKWWLDIVHEVKLGFIVQVTVVYGNLRLLNHFVECLEVDYMVRDFTKDLGHSDIDLLCRIELALDTLFQILARMRMRVLLLLVKLELRPLQIVLLVILPHLLEILLVVDQLRFVLLESD